MAAHFTRLATDPNPQHFLKLFAVVGTFWLSSGSPPAVLKV